MTTSFSEQTLAARHDYFAGSSSGVCDGRSRVGGRGGSLTLRAFWWARMFASRRRGREFYDDPPGAGANLPQRSVIVGAGGPCSGGRKN